MKHTRPNLQIVTLLSRRAGVKDWHIRNKFSEDHTLQRAGRITIQQLIDIAETAKTRWLLTEPTTEFKIEVDG